MSIVVDTSVWIDFFRGIQSAHVTHLNIALEQQTVLLPDMALAEILLGVTTDSQAREIEKELASLELVQIGGRELAVSSARNYRYLRSKGVTIRGTIDLMIGTWCIENDIALLHNDRDYRPMEQHLGLKCVTAATFQ
jgi:predicted nucleic acid-binding protein